MKRTRAWIWAAPVLASAFACGPSFQAVYECDVHFEHCYALDESGASADAKKECWRDWLHGYTYGQSRDRVEYGGTRYSELSLDPTLPSEDQSTPSTRAKHIVAAPAPTNAFAPPPNISGGALAVGPHAPGADCSDGCAQRWTSCRSACKQSGCDVCDLAYKSCMPGCFHDVSAYAPAAGPPGHIGPAAPAGPGGPGHAAAVGPAPPAHEGSVAPAPATSARSLR